jgi:hypothetical protein
MAILNRPTFKSKVADFINRVAPFTDPLIQKTEDNTIRDDMADSAIFKTPEVGSIVSPAAAFNVDFTTDDQINIDTAASGATSFTITIVGLSVNSIGKLNITKKSGDTFTFSNADIYPNFDTFGQDGLTSIAFFVENDGGKFSTRAAYDIETRKHVVTKSGGGRLVHAAFNVGVWDMDANTNFVITWASLSEGSFATLRSPISVLITSNSGNKYDLGGFDIAAQEAQGGSTLINATVINLERQTGGLFDSASFNAATVEISFIYEI